MRLVHIPHPYSGIGRIRQLNGFIHDNAEHFELGNLNGDFENFGSNTVLSVICDRHIFSLKLLHGKYDTTQIIFGTVSSDCCEGFSSSLDLETCPVAFPVQNENTRLKSLSANCQI